MNEIVSPENCRKIEEAASIIAFTNFRMKVASGGELAAKLPLPHIKKVQAEVIAKLAGLHLHRICGCADEHDAHALADDLRAIAAIIDPLIEAIGEIAKDELGISAKQVRSCFEGQLLGALDGNATFLLEERAADMIDERRIGALEPEYRED